MQAHEIRQHEKHGWIRVDTSHIRNVDYLQTHWLMDCRMNCGFYGWIKKEDA